MQYRLNAHALACLTLLFTSAPVRAETTPAPAATAAPVDTSDLLDYSTLKHTISIEVLRAGSHDDNRTNNYFFTTTMYALLNSVEERNAPWDKRKKIAVDLGRFGDTTIDALMQWTPNEKNKDFKEFKVDGNAIRELTARAMHELKVKESELCVQIEIILNKHNKRMLVLGDDVPIGKTSYFPIPPTKFDMPLRTNQDLVISDDKGTNVKIAIRYEKPAQAAKVKPPLEAKDGKTGSPAAPSSKPN